MVSPQLHTQNSFPTEIRQTGKFKSAAGRIFERLFLTENQIRVRKTIREINLMQLDAKKAASCRCQFRAGLMMMEAYRKIDVALEIVRGGKRIKLEALREKLINSAVQYFHSEIFDGGRGSPKVYEKMSECCAASKVPANARYAEEYERSAGLSTAFNNTDLGCKITAINRLERAMYEAFFDGRPEELRICISSIVEMIYQIEPSKLGEGNKSWLKKKITRLHADPKTHSELIEKYGLKDIKIN